VCVWVCVCGVCVCVMCVCVCARARVAWRIGVSTGEKKHFNKCEIMYGG